MPRKNNTSKRRANNEGSVYQRKDGRWCSQMTIGYKSDGKPIRKTIYSFDHQDLLKKMKTMSLDVLNNGYKKDYSEYLFKDLYMEWLFNFKKPSVTSCTFEAYMFRAKNHVLRIGEKKINAIKSIDIQKSLNKMLDLSLNQRTKVYQDYSQFFRYIVAEGVVTKNPMINVVKPKEQRKEQSDDEDYMAIPINERSNFIKALDSNILLKPMALTMMFAGLRIGEVIALKWHNIDSTNKIISIENAANRVTEFNDEGKIINRKSLISDTKTSCSVRQVPIGDFLINVLDEWFVYQKEQEKKFNKILTDKNNVVFTNIHGERREYSGVRTLIDRFNSKNGFKNHHAHMYRHTYATMLFEKGINPKVIQKLMGHRDINTTLKIYNSINKDNISTAIELIEPKIDA